MNAAATLRRATILTIMGSVVLLGSCGGDDDTATADDGPVAITDVWARTTPPGTTVGAVYFTATSDSADRLIGADVDPAVAASATLHSTMTSGSGETSMEDMATLEVPAGGELVLDPAGNHVMLVDLADSLDEGETFELTLHFETAGDETVIVEVGDDAP